jgi:hypothetical protein
MGEPPSRRFSRSPIVVVLWKKDLAKAQVWWSSTSQSQSQSWRIVWQSSTRRRFSQSPSVVVLHKKDLSQKLRKCGSLAQEEGLAQAELEVWQFPS